jgi:hypothetical protein
VLADGNDSLPQTGGGNEEAVSSLMTTAPWAECSRLRRPSFGRTWLLVSLPSWVQNASRNDHETITRREAAAKLAYQPMPHGAGVLRNRCPFSDEPAPPALACITPPPIAPGGATKPGRGQTFTDSSRYPPATKPSGHRHDNLVRRVFLLAALGAPLRPLCLRNAATPAHAVLQFRNEARPREARPPRQPRGHEAASVGGQL